MGEDELREYLRIDFNDKQIDKMLEWSVELGNRVGEYNIRRNPIIPQIPAEQ